MTYLLRTLTILKRRERVRTGPRRRRSRSRKRCSVPHDSQELCVWKVRSRIPMRRTAERQLDVVVRQQPTFLLGYFREGQPPCWGSAEGQIVGDMRSSNGKRR